MILLELFTQPYEVKPEDTHSDMKSYTFTTDEGVEYNIEMMLHQEEPVEAWNVEFTNMTVPSEQRHKVTGSGDQLRVLGTVMDTVTKFAAGLSNGIIVFTSDAANRTSLYERLLKRTIKPPVTYTKTQDQHTNTTFFVVGTQENVQLYTEAMEDYYNDMDY